jgi:hypothetical protein
MSIPSPYRALPPARRVELITEVMRRHKDARAGYAQRISAKGGGFRAVTLRTWPIDKLAREVVRLGAETPQDEFDLLHFLYVDLEPAVQIAFLDAAGVKHANGAIDEEAKPPFADAAQVQKAAKAIVASHNGQALHYLATLAKYHLASWPGLEEALAELAPKA